MWWTRLRTWRANRPRVWRTKYGYNPNSSSLGSMINFVLWLDVVGFVLLNIFAARLLRKPAKPTTPTPETPPDETP